MKIQYFILFFLATYASILPTYGQTETCPENLGFTDGFNGWSGTYGSRFDPFLYDGIISTPNFPYIEADQQPSAGSNVLPRHSILNTTDFSAEPYNALMGDIPAGVSNMLKLGNKETNKGEALERTFRVELGQTVFTYHIAGVLKDAPSSSQRITAFTVFFFDEEGNEIPAEALRPTRNIYAGNRAGGTSSDSFVETGDADSLEILPWETVTVNLFAYAGRDVTVKILALDGGDFGGPFGSELNKSYAYCYFSAYCSETSVIKTEVCEGVNSYDFGADLRLNNILTSFENLSPLDAPIGVFSYRTDPNVSSANAVFSFFRGETLLFRIRLEISVLDCPPPEVLCPKFYLEPDKEYYLTYWSKNVSFGSSVGMGSLSLDFFSDTAFIYSSLAVTTDPLLVNQWVRKEVSFVTPSQSDFSVQLKVTNLGSNSTYFDDIRIIPVNASAVSYVYDPETRRLTAELDNNNYATFYEYDNEGNLLRIKKETETGTHTIQESRLETIKIRQ